MRKKAMEVDAPKRRLVRLLLNTETAEIFLVVLSDNVLVPSSGERSGDGARR